MKSRNLKLVLAFVLFMGTIIYFTNQTKAVECVDEGNCWGLCGSMTICVPAPISIPGSAPPGGCPGYNSSTGDFCGICVTKIGGIPVGAHCGPPYAVPDALCM
jgi:hypothetical protein